MDTEKIEYIDSSFRCHEFDHSFLDVHVKFEVLKMKDSILIWIGEKANPVFSDLSYGIKTPYTQHPLTTKILGTASVNLTSMAMAERLSKKLNKPVYISFNIPITNRQLAEEIESRLYEEMEINREMF